MSSKTAISCGVLGGPAGGLVSYGNLPGVIAAVPLGAWLAIVAVMGLWGLERLLRDRVGAIPQMPRVPSPEQLAAWDQEVNDGLIRRLSWDEAIEQLVKDVTDEGQRQTIVARFDEWFRPARERGLELWEYSSSDQSWWDMCGHAGLALMDDGRVVDAWIIELN